MDAPPASALPWWQRLARSPWVRLLAGLSAVVLPVIVVQLLVRWAALPRGASQALSITFGTIAALLGYRAYVHWIEQRDCSELARAPALREWSQGCALGAALMCATVAVLALLGCYHVVGVGGVAHLWLPLGASLASGIIEELAIRGLVFRLVELALGTRWSLLLSALLFGVLHLGNPSATLAGALAIALEAGVLLAAAFLLRRRLWLPMGIHASWNFFQGGVFGIPVSGNAFDGWLQGRLDGPAWLSGGAFGAEASVVACALCVAAGGWLLWRAWRLGRFVDAPWRAATGKRYH